jgi:hypothetical protein
MWPVFDWQRDVLPVIRATYALMEERGDDFLDWEDLGPHLTRERSESELYNIFQQIKRGGYADVHFAGGMAIAFVQPTEKGLQLTHGWPTPGQGEVDALLRLLDAMIDSPDTSDEERTRLQRLREAAGDVSQSILSGVLGAWLSHVAGLGGS